MDNHYHHSNAEQDNSAFDEFIDYPGSPPPNATADSASDLPTPDLVSPTDPSLTESCSSARTPSPPQGGTWAPEFTHAVSENYFDYPIPPALVNWKKRSSRTQTGLSAFLPAAKKRVGTGLAVLIPRKTSQRTKKIPDGFPCREACGKMYDRECDEKKHYERKHVEAAWWPHECTQCDKRCHYPKDVWRHLEQTHHMTVPPKEPQTIRKKLGCPCCSKDAFAWLQANNTGGAIPTSFPATSPMESEPTSPRTAKKLWSLTQSIISFQKLSVQAKAGKVVMVTVDKKRFLEVEVASTDTADVFVHNIISTLGLPSDIRIASVQSYSRKSGMGPKLNKQTLMALVTKSADSEGNLKLYIEAIRPTLHAFAMPASADPISMMRG